MSFISQIVKTEKMEVQYYSDITRAYHTNYVRNSRAIAVLWGIFTVCFALLNIVVFIQPQWFGDTIDSPEIGFFGLYEYCEKAQVAADFSCKGEFTNFETILNGSFKASGFFVGASALLFLICTACLLLFFFLNTATVLQVCGWIQSVSGEYKIHSILIKFNSVFKKMLLRGHVEKQRDRLTDRNRM